LQEYLQNHTVDPRGRFLHQPVPDLTVPYLSWVVLSTETFFLILRKRASLVRALTVPEQNFVSRAGLVRLHESNPGDDVMILKIFSPKILAKILAFFFKLLLAFCKNMIICNIGF
jgi:hypothetical protein